MTHTTYYACCIDIDGNDAWYMVDAGEHTLSEAIEYLESLDSVQAVKSIVDACDMLDDEQLDDTEVWGFFPTAQCYTLQAMPV